MKQAIKFMALMLVAMLLFASCSAPEAQVPEKTSPNNVSDIVNVTFQNLEAKTTAVSSGTVNNVDIASVFFQYKAKNLSGLKQGETTVWTNLTGEGIPGLGQTIKLGRGLWTLSLRGFATEEARTTAGTKETEETTAIFAGTIDEFSAGNGSSVLTAHADVPLIFTNAAGTGTLKITVNFTEAYAAVENKKVQVNLVVGDTYNETQTLTFGENGAETSAVATFENVANGIATITVDYLDSDGTPFGDSGVANTLIMTDMTTETSATISMDVVKLIVKGNKPTGAPEDYFIPKVFNSIFDIYPDNIYDNAIVVGYKETTKALDASAITYPYVVYKPVEQDENGRYTASSLGLTPIYGLSVDATEAWWGKTAALGGYGTNTKYSLKTVRIVDEATSIKKQAFWLCSKLETVIIPDGVTEIGETAFNGCSKLTSITIPSSVTKIGYRAFDGCGFTSITIPGSVTSFGYGIFQYCRNLTKIIFPEGFTSIPDSMFSYCTGLVSITIPESITSIGSGAFSSCDNLSEINYLGNIDQWYNLGYMFPTSTNITCKNGERVAFQVYKNSNGNLYVNTLTQYGNTLSEITIPDGFVGVGFVADNLLTSITIPASVKSFVNAAFCRNLSEVNYLGNVDQWYEIGAALKDTIEVNCQDGKAALRIYKGMGIDSDKYFCGGLTPYGKTLTEISIPGYVSAITSEAFRSRGNLKTVSLSEGIATIGRSAFRDCYSLESISLPSTITKIDSDVFQYCSNLTEVVYGGTIEQWYNWGYSVYNNPDITCQDGKAVFCSYKGTITDTGETYFSCSGLTPYGKTLSEITIPKIFSRFSSYEFSNYQNITDVYVDVESTHFKSQDGWLLNADGSQIIWVPTGKNITSVTIPDGITTIKDYAFKNNQNITSVTIPDSVTSIGYDAFSNCTGIIDVVYEGPVNQWYGIAYPFSSDVICQDGKAVFKISKGTNYASVKGFTPYGKTNNYTEITIPEGVTSIDGFRDCTNFTSVIIPNSVTSIQIVAFADCTSLTNVTIPSSVTEIGTWAFDRCSALTSVIFSEGLKTIGEEAFEDCTSLTSITLPNSVTTIYEGAFKGCTNLASITIPSSVTSIGKYAFSRCTSLTDIYVNQAESTLLANASVPKGCNIHWNSTGSESV